jgi:rubredoxin
MAEKREPFDGQCKQCNHVWTIAYTPMEVTKFLNVCLKACCPMCGASSKNTVIPPKPEGEKNE